jgi:multiple sugar transport system permease protein
MLMRSIGLYDTQLSLILPYAGAQMALATWIMWSFYQDLPSELFEAALLDGCSPWKLLARIALPLSKAGLLACAILIFVLTWSEFLFALVLTSTKSRTATVALMSFLEQEGMIQWCSLATIGTMMVLPIMLFVFLFRKYLISGLTVGAVKS